jgi:inner membrane protein
MDSLTQIVLGAACGEVVLGKKIGNRALLFGAIGGTIPDLDTFVGAALYTNEIDALLFHRGFMHSILFSILGAFLFGWANYKLYNTGKRLHNTNLVDWIKLYFLALVTHVLLDSFTPYGTQLFAPFSNYRVAFNNIAVADPLYTMPFLLSLIILMCYNRKAPRRRLWLKMGLGISSLYMLLTIGNKQYINSVFEKTLANKSVNYSRFSTQPSILNNVLWYGIAETEDNYQVGFYSLFDTTEQFSDWKIIPRKRSLKKEEFQDLKGLAWFSKDYYNIEPFVDDHYLYTDLRYPMVETPEGDKAIFNFILYKDKGRLNMKPFEPASGDFGFAMQAMWTRLQGQ